MNLQTMRKLDLVVGVPAVYALKAIYALLGLNRRKHAQPEEVKNLLLIKCFGMGSLLLERPFLAEARRVFPNAKVHLLTFDSNRALVELLPEIDSAHYISTRSAGGFVKSVLSSLHRLRRMPIELSFDQEFFSKFTTFCSLAIGAPWRVGFFLQTGWRVNAYTHNAYFNSSHHVALVFLAQIGYALEPPAQIRMELPPVQASDLVADLKPLALQAEDVARAGTLLPDGSSGRVIAINVNAGELSHLRRWPAQYFAGLMEGILAQDPEATLVMIGARSECEYVGEIFNSVQHDGRVRNVCGQMTIAELMAFLAKVDLLISNDSGPIHMAASMGTDTISIFGPETPVLYGPAGRGRHRTLYRAIFCSPCLNVYNNKLTTCTDNVCINKIPVEELLAEYGAWLRETSQLVRGA